MNNLLIPDTELKHMYYEVLLVILLFQNWKVTSKYINMTNFKVHVSYLPLCNYLYVSVCLSVYYTQRGIQKKMYTHFNVWNICLLIAISTVQLQKCPKIISIKVCHRGYLWTFSKLYWRYINEVLKQIFSMLRCGYIFLAPLYI